MRVFFNAVLFGLCFLLCGQEVSAARLLYVPLDDRPVNLAYSVDTLNSAGWTVLTPPRELLASRYRTGEPDRLLDWLEKEAKTAAAAVVSADATLYGGLVASRTHEYPATILAERLVRLTGLKDKTGIRLYVFSTIMRSPKSSVGGVEPPYYEQWGPALFRLGELNDKEETLSLKRRERKERDALLAGLPEQVYHDWSTRRAVNLSLNRRLLSALHNKAFDYLVFGKDDTAPFSQPRREARALGAEIAAGGLYNCRLFAGADQLGLLLLTRAVCDQLLTIPFVHAVYAPGVGGQTVPRYEDTTVEATALGNIYAAGGLPVSSAERADLVLLLNTPPDGITKEAMFTPENTALNNRHSQTVLSLAEKLSAGKPTALADVQFANGSSNALVNGLLTTGLAWRLSAYAGWNTAGNSLGYAIGQGILAEYTPERDRHRLLTVRYLDDWAYQANVRETLYKTTVWPRRLNDTNLGNNRAALEKAALSLLTVQVKGYIPAEFREGLNAAFPWNRLFEVDITVPAQES